MKFLPFLIIILLTACTTGKKGKNTVERDHSTPLDLPPRAPVPPQFYCYQLSQGEKAISLQLTVTGDSIYGQTSYTANHSTIPGTISGIIYGNTLLVAYKEGTGQLEEQEWKMENDSIYRQPLDAAIAEDTMHLKIKYPDRALFLTPMPKVPCSK